MINNIPPKNGNSTSVDDWIKQLFETTKDKKKKPSSVKQSKTDKTLDKLNDRISRLMDAVETKNRVIQNQNSRIDTHLIARTSLKNTVGEKDTIIKDLKAKVKQLQDSLDEKEIEQMNASLNDVTEWQEQLYVAKDQTDLEDKVDLLETQLKQSDLKFSNLQTISEKRLDTINKLKESRDKLVEGNKRVRASLEKVRVREAYFTENPAINRYLRFARNCSEKAEELKADAYCAHGVVPMPAVAAVKDLVGGISICDVIEIPAFSKRAVLSQWHPTMLKTIDMAMESYLRHADHLITIGPALGSLISDIHDDIRTLPNYRYKDSPIPNSTFQDNFNLPKDAKIVLSISTIASGFEEVLKAFTKLPKNVHLINMGKFVPQSYEQEIVELTESLGLIGRVHFMGFVPYDQLIHTASAADMGLIIRDPSIPNNHISLPNRVFDYLAAGLPIVAPHMPDIARITKENNCGAAIETMYSEDWIKGINSVLKNSEKFKKNALKAGQEMTWESLEPSLPSFFNEAKSVTFFGFTDLTHNNRTMRLTRSLVEQGIKVKIAGPVDTSYKLPKGASFVPVEQG